MRVQVVLLIFTVRQRAEWLPNLWCGGQTVHFGCDIHYIKYEIWLIVILWEHEHFENNWSQKYNHSRRRNYAFKGYMSLLELKLTNPIKETAEKIDKLSAHCVLKSWNWEVSQKVRLIIFRHRAGVPRIDQWYQHDWSLIFYCTILFITITSRF